MTDAQSPAKLSGPTSASSFEKDAVAALPEKGRVSRRGNSSVGTPMAFAIGEKNFDKSATAPEAFSIDTATISAHSVGNSLTAVLSPCCAPATKESKYCFFPNRSTPPTRATMRGMGSEEKKLIMLFCSTYMQKTCTYTQKRC